MLKASVIIAQEKDMEKIKFFRIEFRRFTHFLKNDVGQLFQYGFSLSKNAQILESDRSRSKS